MPHTLKTADLEIKALDPDDPAGSFEAILSAPTVDRDREIIDAGAFDPLPDHLSIDTDHGMSTSTTVASGVPYYDGDVLKFRGSWSTIARAQEVRTLVAEGHVRHMSVAFMAAKYAEPDEHDDGWPHIVKAELLNAAITPVPAQTDAVITTAKAILARAAAAKHDATDGDQGDAGSAAAGDESGIVGDGTEEDPDVGSAAAAAADEAAAAAADRDDPAHATEAATDTEHDPAKALIAATIALAEAELAK